MPIGATVGIAAAGLGLQAYGSYKSGQAQKSAAGAAARAAESEAELSDFNATISDQQAADALARGNQQADEFRVQVRGAIGTQRVAAAASNVDVAYGSAADTQADAAYIGKLDELTLRTNAARQAWGYTVQGMNYRQQAKIAREKGAADLEAGNASATAGNIAAIGTIATGAGSLLGKKYGFGAGSNN